MAINFVINTEAAFLIAAEIIFSYKKKFYDRTRIRVYANMDSTVG